VCVVEKGAEVGSHIISGNVFEPRALDELLPNWKELGAPLDTPVTEDEFLLLSEKKSLQLPHILLPPEQHNDGNYIISLSKLVRWLGEQAEEAGVEIYPGFSASEVLYREDGSVTGIATRDVGIGKDGKPKGTFARGMELRARMVRASFSSASMLTVCIMSLTLLMCLKPPRRSLVRAAAARAVRR
jgi:electron-transferring-flavoprotein dehydrogenase